MLYGRCESCSKVKLCIVNQSAETGRLKRLPHQHVIQEEISVEIYGH